MNDLLFYTLLIAFLYYFFFYLPQQKKLNVNLPLKHNQSTQTEPPPIETITTHQEPGAIQGPSAQFVPDPQVIQKLEKAISQKESTIIGLNNSYNKLETKTKQTLDNLKKQLAEKDNKIQELSETEKAIERMIKNIQEFKNELE